MRNFTQKHESLVSISAPPGSRRSSRGEWQILQAPYNSRRKRRMETLDRIKDLATRELSLDPAKLDPNAPLADLGVDSLTFIEFMFKVEDEFGVKVSDEDLRNIKCLADLERHVAASLQAGGKA